MSEAIDMTKGRVFKAILTFFFPMLATNVLQQLYTFVDTAIVGNGLGDHAFAAVGNMSSLCFLILGFSLGLANGFSVLLAQNFGAKDFNQLRHTFAAIIQLACVIIIILTTLSLTFLRDLLELLRTDPIIINDSLKYGYIIFGGLATSILYNVSSFTLRAFGDSRTPLKAIVASSILNVVLDYLFIFVFRTGVEGAAIATIISQLISSLVCINKIRQYDFIKLSKSDFNNPIRTYIRLLQNGVPMAFMNSITAIGCMVVQFFVNGFGVNYTSAYAACVKYLNLFMTPACSAGNTMSSYSGQNSGAKKYDRIQKGLLICLGIAFLTYLIFGSIMVFCGRQMADILLDSEESIQLAMQFFPICGSTIFAVDFLFVFRSAVQGMGHPLVPMCSGIAEMIFRIGVIAVFIDRLGFRATAYAEVAAWSSALIMNTIAYYYIIHKESHTLTAKNK